MYILIEIECTFFYDNFVHYGGDNMCFVTSTELKNNLSHYIELAASEDVFITKNSKNTVVLVNAQELALLRLISLGGCLKQYDDGRDYKEMIADFLYEDYKGVK